MTLDADVVWQSVNTTPSDYALTPTFQTSGKTTLPVELILFNMLGSSTSYTTSTVSSANTYWGQGFQHGNRTGGSGFSFHEDAQGTSDVTRANTSSHAFSVWNNADLESEGHCGKWGYASDGRSIWMDMTANDVTQYINHTSLRFNPMPWCAHTMVAENSSEPDWRWAMPFAPDWIWSWTNTHYLDEWSTTKYAGSSSSHNVFAHRDGTIEQWLSYDIDNQANVDCGTYYSQDAFLDGYWQNGAAYTTYVIDGITWTDYGISLDLTNTDAGYYKHHYIAGKNANSKVGNFACHSSDAGYRASDKTVKITTGFEPSMVFFFGGNRSTPGFSYNWQSTKGFVGPNGNDQWAMGISIEDNDTTSDIYRVQASTNCVYRANYSGASTHSAAEFHSYEEDGFRLQLNPAGSYQSNYKVSYLALGEPPEAIVAPMGNIIE